MCLYHHRTMTISLVFALCFVSSLTLTSCKQASDTQDSSDGGGDAAPQAVPVPTNHDADQTAPDIQPPQVAPTPQVKTVSIEVFSPRNEYLSYGGDCGEDIPGCTPETFYDEVYGTIPNELCVPQQDAVYGLEDISNACLLKTPFISENDFRAANLQPGDIFTTTHKNNLKSSGTQYQVISGIPENAYVFSLAPDGAETEVFKPCLLLGHYVDSCYHLPGENIIRVKVVTGNAAAIPTPAPTPTPVPAPQANAGIPSIPSLVPAPSVTIPPEQRLTFKKSLKAKKGKVEYLIFSDSQLNTDCYISMIGNQEVLNELHYCIPFSGITKELEHPLAPTETARQFEHYAYCTNISVEKRNIPGLAGFLEAFNPAYYNTSLKRFVDRPFQITRPQNKSKKKDNCGGRCRPYDVPCEQNFYSQTPAHTCNILEAYRQNRLTVGMLDYCKIVNPFITFTQYSQYNLRPGDVFLTASAKSGEKVLHQYWQVFDMTSRDFKFNGSPEFIWEYNTCRGTIGQYGEQIVQVRDLSSKDTYDVLYAPIMQGMRVRDNYCKAFNNTLINEARSGNYALVNAASPLLKKK